MKSKTSFFSREVFTRNLKRFWPVWGLLSFVGMMVPLALLLEFSRDGGASSVKMADYFYEFFYGAGEIIAFIYAIVVAMCVWSYLYTSKSISMYHSMPVSRKTLFASSYLSGLAMMLIPFAISGIFVVVISFLFRAAAIKAALTVALGIIAECFIFFTIATLFAHTVGCLAALPIVYFVFNFIVPLWEVLVGEILRGFLFGYTGYYEGYTEFLSPIMFFFEKVDCIMEQYEYAPGCYQSVAVGLRNFYVLGIYAAVSVIIFTASYFLYKNRKSECAGQVAGFGFVKNIFHAMFTVTCALVFGLGFCEVLSIGHYSEYRNPAVFGFSMVFAGILAYFGGYMIIEKNVRVFNKKRALGAAIYSLVFILFVALSALDVFNIQYYHPDTEDVDVLTFYLDGSNITIDPEKNPELYNEFLELQKAIVDDKDVYRKISESPEEADRYIYFNATFEKKDKSATERTYSLGIMDSDLEVAGSSQARLKRFIENPELSLLFLEPRENYEPHYASVSIYADEYDNYNYYAEGQAPAIVLEGLKKDLEEGNWNLYRNCFEMYTDHTGNIEIQYTVLEERNGEAIEADFWRNIYWDNIMLNKEMTNTLEAIEKAGMAKKEVILEALEKVVNDDGAIYPEEVFYEE